MRTQRWLGDQPAPRWWPPVNGPAVAVIRWPRDDGPAVAGGSGGPAVAGGSGGPAVAGIRWPRDSGPAVAGGSDGPTHKRRRQPPHTQEARNVLSQRLPLDSINLVLQFAYACIECRSKLEQGAGDPWCEQCVYIVMD